MSATMARQGGRVQLEQSDMRLALNMAKMAKECFSLASIEETNYFNGKPSAEVRDEKKRGVEFHRHKKVKAVIQGHPAMLRQNQSSSLVLATVPDRQFGSGSGSNPNCCQIGGPGRQ